MNMQKLHRSVELVEHPGLALPTLGRLCAKLAQQVGQGMAAQVGLRRPQPGPMTRSLLAQGKRNPSSSGIASAFTVRQKGESPCLRSSSRPATRGWMGRQQSFSVAPRPAAEQPEAFGVMARHQLLQGRHQLGAQGLWQVGGLDRADDPGQGSGNPIETGTIDELDCKTQAHRFLASASSSGSRPPISINCQESTMG